MVRVGQTSASCNASLGGAMRFNTSNNCVEFCDKTSWKCTNAAAAPTVSTVTSNVTINPSCGFNLKNYALANGWDGTSILDLTVTVNAGVVI